MAYHSAEAREKWLKRMFSAKAVQNGGIIHCDIDRLKEWSSPAALKAEVKKRGYHLLQVGDRYVVVCHHPAKIKIIC
jgi:hypothetical protein